ncbi:hypothetical protein C8F01DRAFT_312076 [Mycena amicta]|nr:hypothetical protein C8F01DRAFT_312076 [Mycena amicta]
MDCHFAFGPNGAYFCKSDTVWAWSDNNTLPERLRLLLEDPNHPQATKLPYDIAFPMEPGTFSMAWQTVRGEGWYEELFLGPRYSKLAAYILKTAKDGQHTLRTVFGPNASYWTMSPPGFSWQNLPPELESDMVGRIRKGQPICVALGVHGSFVVLYSDGNVTFDVLTHYPAVDGIIRNSAENTRRKEIAYVALNPHTASQYYVAFGDGSALWNLPNHFIQDVTTVSQSLKPVVRAGAAGLFAGVGATSPSSGNSTASMAMGKLWTASQHQQQLGSIGLDAGPAYVETWL